MLNDGIVEKRNQRKRIDQFDWEYEHDQKDEEKIFDRTTKEDHVDKWDRNDISMMIGTNRDRFVNERQVDWLDERWEKKMIEVDQRWKDIRRFREIIHWRTIPKTCFLRGKKKTCDVFCCFSVVVVGIRSTINSFIYPQRWRERRKKRKTARFFSPDFLCSVLRRERCL